jgi:hypothetical protein
MNGSADSMLFAREIGATITSAKEVALARGVETTCAPGCPRCEDFVIRYPDTP